ncbi:ArgP/LysG family DNA-binding transcriptional regulator, partial [Cribrihabitans sp. XS_ASV171]
NPLALVRGPVRNGRLVPLLRDSALDVPLCWAVSRIMAPALAPLTRAVRQAARAGLEPETPRP